MIASVEFLGMQRVVTDATSVDIPISENTRVADVLEHINRLYPALYLEGDMIIITVNGEIASPDRILNASDTILFLPVIGGG